MATDREPARRRWLPRPRTGIRSLPDCAWDHEPVQQRVLVECGDNAVRWAMEKTLRRVGYDVATCPGPSSTTRCALLDTGRCDLQAGADVIVNVVDDDRNGWPLARRTVATYPGCPLIVDVTHHSRHDAHLPAEVAVLVSPWSGPKLVDAVDAALGRFDHAAATP
jgi:hypothetical protein